MISDSTFRHKQISSLILIVLFTMLGFYSCCSQAKQRINNIGCEFTAGSHRFNIGEGRLKLRNIYSVTKGISGGVNVGNNLLSLRIRAGYYFATKNVSYEMIVTEFETLVDFYPLEFLRIRDHILDVYLTVGYNYSWLSKKMLSIARQNSDQLNPSLSSNGSYQGIGAGIKYIPQVGRRRTHFFVEALMYNSINTNEKVNLYTNIGIKRMLSSKLREP